MGGTPCFLPGGGKNLGPTLVIKAVFTHLDALVIILQLTISNLGRM